MLPHQIFTRAATTPQNCIYGVAATGGLKLCSVPYL